MENHGVDPDIEALRTPLDWAEGRHAELDDAVHVALDLLKTHPAATPPDYSPDRARPARPGDRRAGRSTPVLDTRALARAPLQGRRARTAYAVHLEPDPTTRALSAR